MTPLRINILRAIYSDEINHTMACGLRTLASLAHCSRCEAEIKPQWKGVCLGCESMRWHNVAKHSQPVPESNP